jgi:hypothetical protein
MVRQIETYRLTNSGGFLPNKISDQFCTLDASDVAEWLMGQGYTVTEYRDTGRNGLAKTECGVAVSTNGWFYFS